MEHWLWTFFYYYSKIFLSVLSKYVNVISPWLQWANQVLSMTTCAGQVCFMFALRQTCCPWMQCAIQVVSCPLHKRHLKKMPFMDRRSYFQCELKITSYWTGLGYCFQSPVLNQKLLEKDSSYWTGHMSKSKLNFFFGQIINYKLQHLSGQLMEEYLKIAFANALYDSVNRGKGMSNFSKTLWICWILYSERNSFFWFPLFAR